MHGLAHFLGQVPLDPHCVIEPRMLEGSVIRVPVVIQHIDAPDKSDLAINAGQLAMQTAQTFTVECEQRRDR